jgi:predicted RNA polymerase sigma factor
VGTLSKAAHAEAIRRAYPSVLAKVLRFTSSLADAEDAVHDAVERALTSWGRIGAPVGRARSLAETYPDEPEAAGLFALLQLHDARRDARLDEQGNPVPLPEQDRSRWDHEAIAQATELLERALAAGAPGPMQTEAAIAAVHCKARRAEETDWSEIASLYALLEGFRPTPAVRVNRAFALSQATAG